MTELTDLQKLVHPFPNRYVKSNPTGRGSYVSHDVVTQRLLHVLGSFSTTLDEIVRGDVPEIVPNPKASSDRGKKGAPAIPNAVVGVVLSLTAKVDSELVTVTEAGDCEDPHNWPHDGARLKDAFSDAIKRCAMRLGVALHVWAQGDFYLSDRIGKWECPEAAE